MAKRNGLHFNYAWKEKPATHYNICNSNDHKQVLLSVEHLQWSKLRAKNLCLCHFIEPFWHLMKYIIIPVNLFIQHTSIACYVTTIFLDPEDVSKNKRSKNPSLRAIPLGGTINTVN